MAESSTYRSRRGGTRAADDRHRRVSVVLVGHSYVWHLDHYMRESKEWMNLQLHNVEVICYEVGGARPNAGAQTEDMVSEVARHHPHIIFVHMGENDLESSTPNQIVCDLLDFVVRLARRCRSHIIVGQLINFPMNHHLTDTVDINVHLRRNMPPGHRFWRHESGLFHNPYPERLSTSRRSPERPGQPPLLEEHLNRCRPCLSPLPALSFSTKFLCKGCDLCRPTLSFICLLASVFFVRCSISMYLVLCEVATIR